MDQSNLKFSPRTGFHSVLEGSLLLFYFHFTEFVKGRNPRILDLIKATDIFGFQHYYKI